MVLAEVVSPKPLVHEAFWAFVLLLTSAGLQQHLFLMTSSHQNCALSFPISPVHILTIL